MEARSGTAVPHSHLLCRGTRLSLESVAVMGVLNVTPDSFSDGGLWMDPKAAIEHALEMHEDGAAIIDIGGESTRPGAPSISVDDELKRVLPVVQGVSERCNALISIDTRKASVARLAVDAGAHIINDTLGEATDGAIDEVAVETGAAIVLMHSRGTPATMKALTDYDDLVRDVAMFLEGRAAELEAKGVSPEAIALDPGIGFAKSPAQNLTLLKRLETITALRWPVLVGTSRKSFIGAVLDLPEDQRLEGTIATTVSAVLSGARLVRVHDIAPAVRAVRMADAIVRAE